MVARLPKSSITEAPRSTEESEVSGFGPRYRRSKDLSHKPIVDALRARGFVVFDVSGLPKLGFDILVYSPNFSAFLSPNRCGLFVPFELKTPDLVYQRKGSKSLDRQKAKLTKSEQQAQQKAPIPTATCVDDILKYF